MQKSVVIDSFPESALRYRDNYAIVVVDVFRFSTTVATALNLGDVSILSRIRTRPSSKDQPWSIRCWSAKWVETCPTTLT